MRELLVNVLSRAMSKHNCGELDAPPTLVGDTPKVLPVLTGCTGGWQSVKVFALPTVALYLELSPFVRVVHTNAPQLSSRNAFRNAERGYGHSEDYAHSSDVSLMSIGRNRQPARAVLNRHRGEP